MTVRQREDLADLFTARGYTHGAEVGVQRGYFAQAILQRWGGRLLCVDPWLHQPNYEDPANVSDDEHDRRYREAARVLGAFGDRATIVRDFSVPTARRQPADSLDFVYLDAKHDTASVRADCAAWWPVIRAGGMLAGHDYLDGFAGMTFGVRTAVNDFAALHGLTVHQTLDQPPSWWLDKPGPR